MPRLSISLASVRSTSLACAVLIYLHLDQQTGYDRFHENLGRVYRIGLD